MTATDFSVLDGAKLLRTLQVTARETLVWAWFGGTTINVYAISEYDGGPSIEERTCFSMCDEEGYAPEREAVEEAVVERMEEHEAPAPR